MNTPNYVYSNLEGMFMNRMHNGLSLYDVAQKCNVSVRALTRYEAGKQAPSKETYNNLANVFGWKEW